tara:strand:- start:1056 stop:1199 length:144 start_codon:yes stop_codon:yes gene_type:complete
VHADGATAAFSQQKEIDEFTDDNLFKAVPVVNKETYQIDKALTENNS